MKSFRKILVLFLILGSLSAFAMTSACLNLLIGQVDVMSQSALRLKEHELYLSTFTKYNLNKGEIGLTAVDSISWLNVTRMLSYEENFKALQRANKLMAESYISDNPDLLKLKKRLFNSFVYLVSRAGNLEGDLNLLRAQIKNKEFSASIVVKEDTFLKSHEISSYILSGFSTESIEDLEEVYLTLNFLMQSMNESLKSGVYTLGPRNIAQAFNQGRKKASEYILNRVF